MALAKIAARAVTKPFRDAKGRFISKAKHELGLRRSLITGRFTSREAADLDRARESEFRKILKAPPAGQTWVKIAAKYSNRFGDLSREVENNI